MAAALAKRRIHTNTLFLVHTKELLYQAKEQMEKWTGGRVGVLGDSNKPEYGDQIVVATVQAMSRAAHTYLQDHFGTLIIDEAHHSVASTYKRVLEHFAFFCDVVGITATPDRGDRKQIGHIFDRVAYEISLPYLIQIGRLSPVTVKALPLKLDLSQVRVKAGDFDAGDCGRVLNPHLERIAGMVSWEMGALLTQRKKAIAFLPTIASAQHFARICKGSGIKAEAIWGEDPDRTFKLASFKEGRIRLLANASLLTEGFDEPSIDMVIPLRPTKVRPLFVQMVGRGMRTFPGKKDMLLMDFLWLHEKHSLIRSTDLFCHNEEERELANRILDNVGEMDLKELAVKAKDERIEAIKRRLEKEKNRKARVVDLISFSAEIDPDLLEYEPATQWESGEVTEGQRAALMKFGVDSTAVTCKGMASNLLDKLVQRSKAGLASPKQIRFLRRHKVAGDLAKMSRGEAGVKITNIMNRFRKGRRW